MNKGVIAKQLDTTKYKYPYICRCSLARDKWVRAEAYINRRGIVGQVTLYDVEGNRVRNKIREDFQDVYEAFVWADNQYDYKHEVFKEVYVNMLLRGEKDGNLRI